ncbi:MAG: potassium channel family protein [Coriobacteriia bacterium]
MRVVIAGCGRVGAVLAAKFSSEGHQVAVIDRDPSAFNRLGAGFTGDTIRGVVFDKQVLESAGIDRTDAFIAVTSGDNSNIVSATIARDIYRVPSVVARIFDPRRADIYRRLGIVTVSSVAWASNEIISLVLHQHLVRDLTLGDGDVQLVRTSLPHRLTGRTVGDLTVSGEVMVVAIVRSGKSFIPTQGTSFHENDVLELAVQTSSMERLKSMMAP